MIPSFILRENMDMKKLIKMTLKAGYRGVEISTCLNNKSREAWLKVKKDLKDFDLITFHFPMHDEAAKMMYSYSLFKRRLGVKLLTDEFEFISQFEPQLYVVHAAKAYSPIEDFRVLKNKCEEYGMRLSIENGKTLPRGELSQVRRTCKLLDVGMTLDIGHAFKAKQNIENLSQIKDVLEHTHLHNVEQKNHQGLSHGFMSIPIVVQALKEINYDKGIVLEIHKDPHFEYELIESKKILDLLWKKF
jgi:sugar phosphate isomerase/epimerase